jgi:hypothetical protein
VNFGKKVAAEVYDETLGAPPLGLLPVKYDESNAMILNPEVAEWAKKSC